jgi:pyruvoyl-dependent arginine decarboxylase (PvlArgDC)
LLSSTLDVFEAMRKKERNFAFLDPAHAGGESEKPSQRKIVASGITTPAPESVDGDIEEQGEKKKSKKKKDGDDKSKTEDSKVSGGKPKKTEEVKEEVKPKTNVDRANAALKEEYHFSETDLANFVD